MIYETADVSALTESGAAVAASAASVHTGPMLLGGLGPCAPQLSGGLGKQAQQRNRGVGGRRCPERSAPPGRGSRRPCQHTRAGAHGRRCSPRLQAQPCAELSCTGRACPATRCPRTLRTAVTQPYHGPCDPGGASSPLRDGRNERQPGQVAPQGRRAEGQGGRSVWTPALCL